ncbi:hypothetical protein F4774DRAFT_403595 [Daldinia eschscholtzii]|nr:hypothetical protein F4774DRAFT_403595 [Daldinia eschscholtzii]
MQLGLLASNFIYNLLFPYMFSLYDLFTSLCIPHTQPNPKINLPMYAPGFALLCLCTLTTIVNALGGGRWPLGIGMNKYVCSFLGGAVINIKQTETTREVDKLPAIRTVSAEWNVPWIKAPDNASLSDSDKRHSLAQWVGIMGDDCDNVNWYPFLQAGTVVEVCMLLHSISLLASDSRSASEARGSRLTKLLNIDRRE